MQMNENESPDRRLLALAGELEGMNSRGLELVRLVRHVANECEAATSELLRATDLTAPRFALLMRLMHEEACGGEPAGISPTHLSRCQNVSKNTISVLVRGLEEQGLIERTLDPDDRRGCRIRVSAAGRALVRANAPRHLAYLNALLAELTPGEQDQLAQLLGKVHQALLRRGLSGAAPAERVGTEILRPEPDPAGQAEVTAGLSSSCDL